MKFEENGLDKQKQAMKNGRSTQAAKPKTL
jgi:hypothetical protein